MLADLLDLHLILVERRVRILRSENDAIGRLQYECCGKSYIPLAGLWIRLTLQYQRLPRSTHLETDGRLAVLDSIERVLNLHQLAGRAAWTIRFCVFSREHRSWTYLNVVSEKP